jgi:hypothetical protein
MVVKFEWIELLLIRQQAAEGFLTGASEESRFKNTDEKVTELDAENSSYRR